MNNVASADVYATTLVLDEEDTGRRDCDEAEDLPSLVRCEGVCSAGSRQKSKLEALPTENDRSGSPLCCDIGSTCAGECVCFGATSASDSLGEST